MEKIIYLDREYIKYRENLGFDPRKPLKFDSEWQDWVEYKNKKWPKSKYKETSHNILELKNLNDLLR